MGTLSARDRANLPDSAFAYIDSHGRRKLPISDEAHIRNALARFSQVTFESEEARERAFRKLLTACSRFGIAPVGFVSRRLREAQGRSRSDVLPSGLVTLLLADIEGSTHLATTLGADYPRLLEEVRAAMRAAVAHHSGYEVDARGDEFFAAFSCAADAVEAATSIHRDLEGRRVRVRIGLHSGSPAMTDTGYEGIVVHVLARVAEAGHGGQTIASPAAATELGADMPPGMTLRTLGAFELRGLPDPYELFQVDGTGRVTDFPPPRGAVPWNRSG